MKLLIVDDHPVFRVGLKQIVSRMEAVEHIAEADTCEAALTLVQLSPPDVIMLDLALPGMDGLQLMEALKEHDIASKTVVVTSYDDKAYLDRAFELGARGYVIKDCAITDVIDCIATIESGGIYVSPSLGRSKVAAPLAHHGAGDLLKTLTPTEKRVLRGVASFLTSKEIARELDMSYRTVQNHRSHICTKLGLKGAHQLMSFATEHVGLICAES